MQTLEMHFFLLEQDLLFIPKIVPTVEQIFFTYQKQGLRLMQHLVLVLFVLSLVYHCGGRQQKFIELVCHIQILKICFIQRYSYMLLQILLASHLMVRYRDIINIISFSSNGQVQRYINVISISSNGQVQSHINIISFSSNGQVQRHINTCSTCHCNFIFKYYLI